MSSRNSLLKRAAVPLLAVAAAAALCAPVRASVASLDYAGPNGPNGIAERVRCTMTGDSTWNTAIFNANSNTSANSHTDNNFTIYGPGDYYRPSSGYVETVWVPGSNTYDCYCECDGVDYYNNAWQAFTGHSEISN